MSVPARSRLKKRKKLSDFAKTHHRTPQVKSVFSQAFVLHLIKKHRKLIYWLIALVIAIILLIPVFTYIYFAGDLQDKNTFTNRSRTGLTLMDREGETFFTFYQPKAVTYIPLSDIPKDVQEAVVATEDKKFYTNAGFSITGMGRAFIRNLLAGQVVEGGSTISQELVKIALLNSDRNILRKYQELVLATELNRRFSKDDILEMYLNSVYFGEGAFGIENAAQAYFGIAAKDLTLAQASMLAGLLPAPSAYSPISGDESKALRRQQIVLGEMVEENYITQAEADSVLSQSLTYNPAPIEETNTLAPHFALYVKDQLLKKYGEERIIREGFRVKTSLNRTQQEYAERAVQTRIAALTWNKAGNGATVAIDPETSEVLVMVGSHDWNDDKWGKANMAVTPRQTGSSFKPIIYADGLERKIITPATILDDTETSFGSYKPQNYDKRFRGDVTVRRALANSLNIPAVEVMEKVGVSNGMSFAKKLGITTLDEETNYGLSLVLGTGEVPLLEMTNAYAVFANEGVYHQPKTVLEIKNKYDRTVETKDKSIFAILDIFHFFTQDTDEPKTVMGQDASFLISSILSDNNARAESFGGALTISRPAAVKTGTTEEYRDAWTIGYTPDLVVGVWVGNNDNTSMDNVAGSLGAAPIWRNMMETYLMGTTIEQFRRPFTVVEETICIPGRTPYQEYFLPGTEEYACEQPTATQKPTEAISPSPTKKPDEPTSTPTPQPTNTPIPQVTNTPQPTPTTGVGNIIPTVQTILP
ncbi:MAG: transglycosylase domain-containing protein [Patescibacteria group bacterium]